MNTHKRISHHTQEKKRGLKKERFSVYNELDLLHSNDDSLTAGAIERRFSGSKYHNNEKGHYNIYTIFSVHTWCLVWLCCCVVE